MRTSNTFNRRLAAALLAALAIAPTAIAQTSGGSTYSIFNLGDLRAGTTAAAAGRGGVESAVPSHAIINSLNPALWSDLSYVTLQAAMNFEQYKVSDALGTIYQNQSKLQDFSVAFPYSQAFGGTLAFSVRPYSTVNYRTQLERTIQTGDTTTRSLITYSGQGGLSEALLGSSFEPAEWISIGISGSLLFGSVTTESAISFPDNNTLSPARYQKGDLYMGGSGRFGVAVKPSPGLTVGGVFETGGTLSRERSESTRLIDNNRELIDTTMVSKSDLKLPPRIILGASYQTGRFLLASDAIFHSWDKEDFPTARPSSRFAAGVDRLPSESINASGFERWTFRLGGYYEQTYYELANGTGIDQMGLTLGARVPISQSGHLNAGTALDLAVELGQRGSINNGLTQELYGKLWVQLGVSELWFVRRR